ncbi:MAG: RsmE family RNA methyltransferase, partial [Bdellovibrionales bacterium]|nr:RsmE family RNA methyltransferase [Bdellovibrionales bacterium]
KIIEVRDLPPLKKPHLHLALSLPKFSTLERVIEKSVELGVHTVHLFSSDFSFMKPKPGELVKKQDRWNKIIKGATQQTGRGDLMELTEVTPLDVLLKEFASQPQTKGLLAYEGDAPLSLKQALSQRGDSIENLWVFVGSEGGFSASDLELFNDSGLLPISLGDQVLRVETACVTLLSILKYGIGHFDEIGRIE